MNAPSKRTALQRHPERGHYDAATIHRLLDAAPIVHVGISTAAGPLVLPMAHGRIGDRLYLHGAVQNALLQATSICVEATHLDALVLAKSPFHHSMNFRSVVVRGDAYEVSGPEKELALEAIVDHILPGRSAECRPSTPQEIRATRVLGLPLSEASAKIRTGGPKDKRSDKALPHWSGLLPHEGRWLAPVPTGEAPLSKALRAKLLGQCHHLCGQVETAEGAVHGDPAVLRDHLPEAELRHPATTSFAVLGTSPSAYAKLTTDGISATLSPVISLGEGEPNPEVARALHRFLFDHPDFAGIQRWVVPNSFASSEPTCPETKVVLRKR